jgi:hypothetical protein
MDRQAVTSSELTSIGYNPTSHVLEVEFRTGRVYEYHEVPDDVHSGLIGASSLGRYFNEHVKHAGYTCIRLR